MVKSLCHGIACGVHHARTTVILSCLNSHMQGQPAPGKTPNHPHLWDSRLSGHPWALPGPVHNLLIIQARLPSPSPACPPSTVYHISLTTLIQHTVIFITHRRPISQPSLTRHSTTWRTSAFSSTPRRHHTLISTPLPTATNSLTPAAQRHKALRRLPMI